MVKVLVFDTVTKPGQILRVVSGSDRRDTRQAKAGEDQLLEAEGDSAEQMVDLRSRALVARPSLDLPARAPTVAALRLPEGTKVQGRGDSAPVDAKGTERTGRVLVRPPWPYREAVVEVGDAT